MSEPSEPVKSCILLSTVIVIFLTVFGGLFLGEYNSFQHDMHLGRIVHTYVSKTQSSSSSSAAIINRFQDFNGSHSLAKGRGGSSSGGGTSRTSTSNSNSNKKSNPKYYVMAIFSYPVSLELNNTLSKNCSMTMREYSKESEATKGLRRVPIGKEKGIYVSRSHHGKYCIDKRELFYSYNTGMILFMVLSGWLLLACVCTCGCREDGGHVRIKPEQGVQLAGTSSLVQSSSNGRATSPPLTTPKPPSARRASTGTRSSHRTTSHPTSGSRPRSTSSAPPTTSYSHGPAVQHPYTSMSMYNAAAAPAANPWAINTATSNYPSPGDMSAWRDDVVEGVENEEERCGPETRGGRLLRRGSCYAHY